MEWCQPLFSQLRHVADRLETDKRFRCSVWTHSVAEKLPIDGYTLGIECRHRSRCKPSRLRMEIRMARATTVPRLLYAGIHWGGERSDGYRLARPGPLSVEQVLARFPIALRRFEQAARHWDPNVHKCKVSVSLTGPSRAQIQPGPIDQDLLRCALQAQGWTSLVLVPWPYCYISPPEALTGAELWKVKPYILNSQPGLIVWPEQTRLNTRRLYEKYPQALGTAQVCPVYYAPDGQTALVGLVRYSWTGVGWPDEEVWHLCRRAGASWVSETCAEPDPTPGFEHHTTVALSRLQQAGVDILEQEHSEGCPFPVRLKVRYRGTECHLVVTPWRQGHFFSLEPVAFLNAFGGDRALAVLNRLCPA